MSLWVVYLLMSISALSGWFIGVLMVSERLEKIQELEEENERLKKGKKK